MAAVTASARRLTPSFEITWLTWIRTVPSLMPSSRPISGLLAPLAIRARISSSRAVSRRSCSRRRAACDACWSKGIGAGRRLCGRRPNPLGVPATLLDPQLSCESIEQHPPPVDVHLGQRTDERLHRVVEVCELDAEPTVLLPDHGTRCATHGSADRE